MFKDATMEGKISSSKIAYGNQEQSMFNDASMEETASSSGIAYGNHVQKAKKEGKPFSNKM